MTSPIALVSDIAPRSQHTADGVQVAFPSSWPLRSLDDLVILFNDGEEPEIVYSVTGVNDDDGFTITFNTPPPSGTKITVLRRGGLERSANYGLQKQFVAATVNAELVDLVLRLQELANRVNRAVGLPDTDPARTTTLPLVAERAGKYLGFDSLGNVVALASSGQIALDFAQFPTGTPIAADSFIFNDADDATGSPVRKATLETLAALITGVTAKPFRTAGDLALAGDGVTDDSFKLQADMEAQSAEGGATYWLRSPVTGGSFYFAHSPRVPSNITIIASSPFLLAKAATFRLAGRLSAVAGKDSFRLLENAVLNANTLRIDTAPHGGGLVSTHFAIGDHFQIIGNRDGCATPQSEQELRVVSITDGNSQIQVDRPLVAAFQVTYAAGDYETNYGTQDRTTIRKLRFALATADVAAGENLIPIRAGDAGQLAAGDMVLLKDDKNTDDFPGTTGSTSAPCNEELAVIVASVSGDPANTLRLDRRTSRPFTTAENFRLIRVEPTVGAALSGARFLSAEAPDLAPAPRVNWCEQRYARGCIFDSCAVPNTDVFGKRGTAFNHYRCLEPRVINCDAARAKYFDNGEGNGIVFDRSTGGKVIGGIFDAMRHATQCVSGNGHDFHNVLMLNPRHAPVDAHGTYEVDCHWYDCTLVAGTQYEPNEGRAPTAIVFGNSTWLAGSHRCGFHGGTVIGFKNDGGSLEACINLFPGATNCVVEGNFKDIGQLFRFRDTSGFGSLVSSGHRIKAYVDGCENTRLVDIQGRANGASVDTLVDARIEVYGRRLNGGFFAVNTTELEVAACDLDESVVDASATYFVEAQSCPGLRVLYNRIAGWGRFVSVTNCTNYRIIGNRPIDQTFATMLNDGGGCSGIWLDNVPAGFLPFWTPHATSSITLDGRLPGHVDLADDTVLKIFPVNQKGTGHFYSVTGTAFNAHFYYDTVTSVLDLGSFSTVNVDASTSALAGTTGVDGRVTVSCVNADNSLQTEQRTGGTIRVAGRVD